MQRGTCNIVYNCKHTVKIFFRFSMGYICLKSSGTWYPVQKNFVQNKLKFRVLER